MLVDSHCHLNYLDEPDEALRAARGGGVRGFLCIGVDRTSIDSVLALAARNDDVWASVGEHPEAASDDPEWVGAHLDAHRVVAVGEMGLDFFRNDADDVRRRQQDCFDYQLGLAAERGLPAVIHTRAAEAETRDMLIKHAGATGVLHCFTESWELAKKALDLGYYISISGIVTFKNGANVREVAAKVPKDRLLVETDSPWLAPVPHRGKQNQPAFVVHTARFLAELLDWEPKQLERQTTENFFRLFSCARDQS